MARFAPASWLLSCAALAVLSALRPAAAQACTSGVVQIKAFPADQYDACFAGPPTQNSIKAVCMAALRVTSKNGIIRLVPIETGTFNYGGPGPFTVPSVGNCKDFNASGLISASGKSAAVMLLDNYGGPLSNFTRNGNQITLSPGVTYSYKSPPPVCAYNYTVVSGCVLGLKAPAKAPACPRGFAAKTGRFGTKYCAPCLHGTYSSKPNSASCSVCPRGQVSGILGSTSCRRCSGQEYQPARGKTFCDYCSSLDNRYTDNVAVCKACPKGSFPSAAKPGQCVRCYAGKKCCTVGFGKDCPKCTSSATPATYTSLFALESATPASCLGSNYALCAPKINITVDGTCTITMNNLQNENNIGPYAYCQWSATAPIKAAQINGVPDFNFMYFADNNSLPAGNATLFKSPYIDFYLPTVKCKLRYRALTAPAAKLLGAAPKAAKPSTCPAGSYIDTSTDTKPGPCLPCPPGTYSAKAGTKSACTPCAPSTYAKRFGATKCSKCPAGLASGKGAAACNVCNDNANIAINGKCLKCPANTDVYYKGFPHCLANAYGTICCAGGDCKGQIPCSGPRTALSANTETYGAVLQLSSTGSQCPKGSFLNGCLRVGDKVQVKSSSSSLSLDFLAENVNCRNNKTVNVPSFYGGVASSHIGYITGYDGSVNVGYELRTTQGSPTVTMTLITGWDGSNYDLITPGSLPLSKCTATFTLTAGYLLSATPPPSAKCPPAYATSTYNGRTFCTFCGTGSIKTSAGTCQTCPGGYYQDSNAATACKPCPVGTSCYSGSYQPQCCSGGQYAPKPKSADCIKCKPNTFTTGFTNAAKCSACPKGLVAPEGASACGIVWEKAFA